MSQGVWACEWYDHHRNFSSLSHILTPTHATFPAIYNFPIIISDRKTVWLFSMAQNTLCVPWLLHKSTS